MINLLKFEFYKLARAKSFYIFLGAALFSTFLSALVLYVAYFISKDALEETIEGFEVVNAMVNASSGTEISITVLSYANFTTLFGLFTAIFICDDFSQKTIKNVYSRGFTRTQVFFAKIIAIAAAMLVAYLVVVTFGFLVGLLLFGEAGEFQGVVIYFEQFLYILAFMAFVAFVTFTFKKIAVSILFALIVPSVFATILTIIDMSIGSETFKLSLYWFGNYELYIYAGAKMKEIIAVLAGATAYTGIFTLLGWLVSRNNTL